MTPEDRRSYEAHKSGTLKLQPFYENAMDDMAHEYLKSCRARYQLTTEVSVLSAVHIPYKPS